MVAAAANNSSSAAGYVPAAYNEVITVSALADTDGKPGGLGGDRCFSWGTYDVDDTFANFSNYGRAIDLIAPGVCIYSTSMLGGYATLSGTSMASPHVDSIGQHTSRKIGKRGPSEVDVEKAVEAALETGTFLEINSQPDRLDLRDANARLAGEAGLTLVISSDGHSTGALAYVGAS